MAFTVQDRGLHAEVGRVPGDGRELANPVTPAGVHSCFAVPKVELRAIAVDFDFMEPFFSAGYAAFYRMARLDKSLNFGPCERTLS
jgi:hypothetical protein